MLSILKSVNPAPDFARLDAEKAALATAKNALTETRATFEHMESIVRGGDDAARVASTAAQKVNDARSAWVRAGCPHSGSREIQTLEETAAAAARTAERAAADAKAITKELRRLESELESRQADIRHAERGITSAIGVIVAAEAGELLARYEKSAQETRDLRAQVIAVRDAITRPWSLSNKNSRDPSYEGLEVVEASMERARIKTFDEEIDGRRARDSLDKTRKVEDWLDGLKAPWRARITALRGEPNAN
jgi:hypothetical protein